MAPRTGVPTLLQVAKRMCDLITRYATVIELAYPSSPALHAALAAAMSACSVLESELAQVREIGD